MSSGPNALGTARIMGGMGDLMDTEGEAVESISARAYSAIIGPVGMSGNLTIGLPYPSDQDLNLLAAPDR